MKTQIIQLTFYKDNTLVFVNVNNITHFATEDEYTRVYFSTHFINVKETPMQIQAKIV